MSEALADRGLGGLKEIRLFLGLSQANLAKAVGVTTEFLARIETGKQDCSLALVRQLAYSCACEPADLMAVPSERRLCGIRVDYADRQAHEAKQAVALFTDVKP